MTTETTQSVLTSERVRSLFKFCLFNTDEDMTSRDEVVGILASFGFHLGRLEQCRDEIAAMLLKLAPAFRFPNGPGRAVLGAVRDRLGRKWGDPMHVEELVALGIGLGLARYERPNLVVLAREPAPGAAPDLHEAC